MRACDVEKCDRPHRAKGLCALHYRHRFGRNDRLVEVPCGHCAVPLLKQLRGDRKVRFCGTTCHAAYTVEKARAQRAARSQIVPFVGLAGRTPVPPHHQSRRKDGLTTGGAVVYVAGQCVRCNAPATVRIPRGVRLEALTCSRSCAKAEEKSRRRALQKAAYVEPVRRSVVFARDGYTCQLCGLPLDMDQSVPHPMAPTIDHIVPLAPYLGRAGGDHSMSNAQSAHYLCNSLKGHRVG